MSEEISPEERQKIVDAFKAGRVEWSEAGKEYFEQGRVIAIKNPDYTLTSVEVVSIWGPWEKPLKNGNKNGNNGGMSISWSTVSAGFGELIIYLTKENELRIESEGMSKDFCKQVLTKLIDNAEVDK